MKRLFLELSCASVLCALTIGAQAQAQYGAPLTPPSTPGATTYGTPRPSKATVQSQAGESKPNPEAQAAEKLRAAQLKCNEQSAEQRETCLRDAQKSYEDGSSAESHS